jgi:3-oxo-5-alpha-steroid 4-dehydrogenase 1
MLYDELTKYFATIPLVVLPILFVIDAPFGRFTWKNDRLNVDGIKAWIIMELPSPITMLSTFRRAPLAPKALVPPLNHPCTLLAALYAIHYANRALISPLRTPSRSRSHIMVPIAAVAFNLTNGYLMGAFLSAPDTLKANQDAFSRPSFWIGVFIWALGFVGNIVHDEILLNIRRKKMREEAQQGRKKSDQEHYSIPHGLLYRWISYPNYFCEWIEWIGFALAASPSAIYTPPWLFVSAEVCTMLPRAWKGHLWYKKTFPDFPKERKAVVPFCL